MSTSSGNFPRHLTKIDELTRRDHYHLQAADVCYFLGEYTSHEGYQYSETNQLIFNFKKDVSRRGRPEWTYKDKAIRKVAAAFREAIPVHLLDQLTLVPIPPSMAKSDPLYDDRIAQMLHQIRPRPPLDVRGLIVQKRTMPPSHTTDQRPSPETIGAGYMINEGLADPAPEMLVLVDDVLTTGAHFRAAQEVLLNRFPGTPIEGLFIARRVSA